MNDPDNILRAALAFHAQREPAPDVQERISAISESPMKAAACSYLRKLPEAELRRPLEALISINQGTVADLMSQEFRSYLMRTSGLSDEDLLRCHDVLATFEHVHLAQQRGSDENVSLYAAREEEPEIGWAVFSCEPNDKWSC